MDDDMMNKPAGDGQDMGTDTSTPSSMPAEGGEEKKEGDDAAAAGAGDMGGGMGGTEPTGGDSTPAA